MEYQDLSAVEIVKQIRSKGISAVELMEDCLRLIETVNPKINAFVTVRGDEAIAEAKEKDEAVMRGEKTGPLHGVPVAIKDITLTKGIRTTFGSPLFQDYIPDRDATVVQRLKNAGAIIVGKTNTPEFGYKATTDNSLFGPTKNPWNLKLTAGGSSGGSAAAVAAGLVPLAEGTDVGGSIRSPASLCGVFGMKPTYGRIPVDNSSENAFGSGEPFFHHGPISRTAKDAALFLSVTQGQSNSDPFSLPIIDGDPLEEIDSEIHNLKIAYTPDFGLYEISYDVQQVIESAVGHLRSQGLIVEEVSIDLGGSIEEMLDPMMKMWSVYNAANYGELFDKHPEAFPKSLAQLIQFGRTFSAVEYRRHEIKRTERWAAVQNILNRYDLLISPTLATTAFDYHLEGPLQINGKAINPAIDWALTQLYNMTGHPAASMPIGMTKEGLPVGLQVAGNRNADHLVLRFAHAYEKNFNKTEYVKL